MEIKSIFIADDDEDDIDFFKSALIDLNFSGHLSVSKNGQELLDILNTGTARPDILFLDVNMPLLNGYECLNEIKNIPNLNYMPVVILTTSASLNNIEISYKLGASMVVEKPFDYNILKKTIDCLLNFDWQTHKPKNLNNFLFSV